MLADDGCHMVGCCRVGKLTHQPTVSGDDLGIRRIVDSVTVASRRDLLFDVDDAMALRHHGDLLRRSGHAADDRMQDRRLLLGLFRRVAFRID